MPTNEGGVAEPNFTQVPNIILDNMQHMSDAELRVVLAIVRKTKGWHKETDELSISQLMKLTGLSNTAAIRGGNIGAERGIIKKTPVDPNNSRKGFTYGIIVKEAYQESFPLVNESHKAYERKPQVLVNDVHTQKKGKESIKENGGGNSSIATDNPSPVPSPTAAVTEKNPTEQRPTATEIVAPILKELEAAKRQQAQEYQSNESAILKAFEALNQSIRAGRNPYNPITGTKQLAEKLAARGETEVTMKAAWDTCKANGYKPMGAFMKWIQDGYLPPQQEGQETKVFNGTIHVWTDDGGWTDTGRKAV